MKILLLCLLFLAACSVAPAQDKPSPSDVLIPLPVATFFLEQNERAKILQVEVDTLHADVILLEKLDSIRQIELATLQQQVKVYDSLVSVQKDDIEACWKAEAGLSKELKKQKNITKIVGAAGIVLIILALL